MSISICLLASIVPLFSSLGWKRKRGTEKKKKCGEEENGEQDQQVPNPRGQIQCLEKAFAVVHGTYHSLLLPVIFQAYLFTKLGWIASSTACCLCKLCDLISVWKRLPGMTS